VPDVVVTLNFTGSQLVPMLIYPESHAQVHELVAPPEPLYELFAGPFVHAVRVFVPAGE
jgi:hypothetical protein